MLKTKTWKVPLLIVLTLTALTVIFAPDSAAAESRIRVSLDEPFEVNGQLFDGDVLTLQQVGRYNPTSTIHEVRVGNRSLGLLLARHESGVSDPAVDSLIFSRNVDGRLALVGVAYRDQSTHEFYRFVETADAHRWLAPPRPRPTSHEPATLVASVK